MGFERNIIAGIDAVVHNGSEISQLKYCQGMRVDNMGSTTYLLIQCLARRVPFRYVYSIGVDLFRGPLTFPGSRQRHCPPR